MANDYFRFKQFTVQQQKAALKVCTDACIFGAYAASYLQATNHPTRRILDIGTGTGLLSLMLAQKVEGTIDAVEVDEESYMQAKENFAASKWSERLKAIQVDANEFKPGIKYDVVICNPPFFQHSLQSATASKNLAKHVDGLTLPQLTSIVAPLLTSEGLFFVLLPFIGFEEFTQTAAKMNFHLLDRLNISHSKAHPFFRSIGIFSFNKSNNSATEELQIKEAGNNYTKDFIILLKDYYLYL